MTVEDIYGAGCVNLGKESKMKNSRYLMRNMRKVHENLIINYE